jgi:hypothetical protein
MSSGCLDDRGDGLHLLHAFHGAGAGDHHEPGTADLHRPGLDARLVSGAASDHPLRSEPRSLEITTVRLRVAVAVLCCPASQASSRFAEFKVF